MEWEVPISHGDTSLERISFSPMVIPRIVQSDCTSFKACCRLVCRSMQIWPQGVQVRLALSGRHDIAPVILRFPLHGSCFRLFETHRLASPARLTGTRMILAHVRRRPGPSSLFSMISRGAPQRPPRTPLALFTVALPRARPTPLPRVPRDLNMGAFRNMSGTMKYRT